MYSDDGLNADLDEVRKVIDGADVFTIGFPLFNERLLVDARPDEVDGPLVRIVEPVTSVQERFYELGRLRPRLDAPERFVFFIWPNSVRYFEESGVLDQIQRRCAVSNGRGSVTTMCAEAIDALRGFEHDAVRDAIDGDGYKTIWSASGMAPEE
jgi:hypothetical protein